MNPITDVLDPASGELFRRLVVELFNVLGGARLVLGADVDRQIAGLAPGDEQPFNGRKIGLGRAVLLEHVTPPTSASLEIQASPDVHARPSEPLDLALVGGLGGGRLAAASALWNKDLSLARAGAIVYVGHVSWLCSGPARAGLSFCAWHCCYGGSRGLHRLWRPWPITTVSAAPSCSATPASALSGDRSSACWSGLRIASFALGIFGWDRRQASTSAKIGPSSGNRTTAVCSCMKAPRVHRYVMPVVP